jgi:hypothetical protein
MLGEKNSGARGEKLPDIFLILFLRSILYM